MSVVVRTRSQPAGWRLGEHACPEGSGRPAVPPQPPFAEFLPWCRRCAKLSHTALRTGEFLWVPFSDEDTEAHWGQVSAQGHRADEGGIEVELGLTGLQSPPLPPKPLDTKDEV